MASTYSTSLRLELMATGDQSGTWGDTTNTNLGTLLEQAITGVLSVAQGDATLTLTALDGATDQSRNAVVNLTGAMTANRNVVVPTANKLYLIKNSTSGGFVVTVKTAAGTGVTVPNGTARWVYCDGTNVVDGMSGPWSPSSNDAQALGASGTAWSDLFLASGGVVNWNAGDVTITHSANTLAFAGASSGYSFDAGVTLESTDAGATAGPILTLYRNSASPAASDILGQVLFNGEDSAGNTQEYASIEAIISDATTTAEDGDLDMYATVAGTRRKLFSINSTQALYGRPLPTLSNNSGDATNDIDFAAGAASDLSTTATGLMWVTCAAMTKQLDANWAAGTNQGMRYSGAAIANTTYQIWAAWTDAGTQDYYADPSADQATVLGHLQAESGGSTYTHIRRIGAIIRSSAAIVAFTQRGDEFLLKVPVKDINVSAGLGTTAISYTLSVPTGIQVDALIYASGINGTGTWGILLSALDQTDTAAVYLGPSTMDGQTNAFASASISLRTNTSAQIRARASRASSDLYETTRGWIDTRGRV